MTDTFLKYVNHADIPAHLSRGWIVVSDAEQMRHHGRHSVLMEWRG